MVKQEATNFEDMAWFFGDDSDADIKEQEEATYFGEAGPRKLDHRRGEYRIMELRRMEWRRMELRKMDGRTILMTILSSWSLLAKGESYNAIFGNNT